MSYSISDIIGLIAPLQKKAAESAAEHLDRLTKPPGSLGKLEELAVQLAGITGQVKPSFPQRAIIVMAADHGVCEEGISAFPAEVTPQMVLNFCLAERQLMYLPVRLRRKCYVSISA